MAIIVHKDVNEEKLHALKHEFNDILTTQIHNYFSGDCIEVFIVNGNAERVKKFSKELKNPNYTYSKLIIPS
ncbi:Putative nickel-responsive regulator [uncultured archaeon]|nr:Putative nickel-responsive regulator [uncultured archaeon]